MKYEGCLFCKIIAGEEPSTKIWEDEEFLCIKNKYPISPVHVLVMPKAHIKKVEVASPGGSSAVRRVGSLYEMEEFWGKIMLAVFSVVSKLNLDKTGYKLVNNGAGYNHFEHEHIHILGGSKTEPGGKT